MTGSGFAAAIAMAALSGQAAAPAPALTPAAAPRALRFELAEPPAATFGRVHRVEADRDLAALVDGLPGVRYEPALGRAARELARFHRREGELAPSGFLAFLLTAAGTTEWGVQQVSIELAPGDDAALRARVRELVSSLPRGAPGARIGLGESVEPGPPARRHVAVLLSLVGVGLEPVPTAVARGARVPLAFRLPAGWSAPEVLALTPSLDFVAVPLQADGTTYKGEVATGDVPGVLSVEVLASGPTGPGPLAQLDIQVDRDPPRVYEGSWPPDEKGITSHAQAADLVYRLLTEDRQRVGLPPLVRDPALDAIARSHSRDMRDHGFVGHLSPTTGLSGRRLAVAGYKAIAHGENVARDGSLYEAEGRLLASLGHRRNLLATNLTHVGIGVALSIDDGIRVWHLTQLFARPAAAVDREETRRTIAQAIDRERGARGLKGLVADPSLDDLAQSEAESADPAPRRPIEKLRGWGAMGAYGVVVETLPEASQFSVPEQAIAAGAGRVGIGVHQDFAGDAPQITVVVITGE